VVGVQVLLNAFLARNQVSKIEDFFMLNCFNLFFLGITSVKCDIDAKQVLVEGADGLDLCEMLAKWVRNNYFIKLNFFNI
jgi:hypothetical protein